jgi:predicted ATP-dependent serine protease
MNLNLGVKANSFFVNAFGASGNNFGKIVDKIIWPVIIGGLTVLVCHLTRKQSGVPISSKGTIDKIKTDFSKNQFSNAVPSFELVASKKTEEVDITKEPFLLFDKLIHRKEIACIFSAPGVGKTFLACFIAKNALPMKTVYFALDDQGSSQLKRINCIPSIQCVSRNLFDEYLAKIKANAVDICEQRAILDTIFPISAKIEDRRKRLIKELGCAENDKVDELLLFELLMETQNCREADIIVLDSLNALLNYDSRINRLTIDRVTYLCRKQGKTLIILHHTNKKNEIAGHSSLTQVVDLVLRMDKIQDNIRILKVEKSRFIQKSEQCVVQMISDGDHAVKFEETPLRQQIDMPSLDGQIIEILKEKDSMPFKELFASLNIKNEGSLKNSLKRLEENGYVSKEDEKKWTVVKNCKPFETIV